MASEQATDASLERIRQLEERAGYFRALIETNRDTVSVVDAQGRRLYLSPSFVELTGYQPEEVLGQSIFELLHPEDIQTAKAAFRDILRHGDQQVDLRLRHKHDGWRHVEILGRNLLDHSHVRGIVSTLRDITRRRELEQQLLQAQKMEAVGRLAASVAHDFNNLLMVIDANAEMLRGQLHEGSRERGHAEHVLEAARKASSLTRQLLAFSRRDVVDPRMLDLRDIVREMDAMLRRIIGDDITLTTHLDEAHCWVRVDPRHFEQVIMNLVVNARDAMPHGGHVEIRCAAEGNGIVLAVQDDGAGMSDDVRARVFDPFFTTKADGTGLGLSIVYGVVRATGGEVHVETTPAKGTTFTIVLPKGSGERTVPELRASAEALPSGHETVLLVEDEDAVRKTIRELLEGQGYRVLEARDGQEALEVAEAGDARLDLLVTDVVMPAMKGLSATEVLGAGATRIPIIYMPGHADDARVPAEVRDPALRLLPTPFTAAQLARAVRMAIDEHAASRLPTRR